MTDNAKHAKYSPSAAHRWIKCTASLALHGDAPNTSSKYANEGTAAHELAALCLEKGQKPIEYVGRNLADNVEVTEDMAENVEKYVDDILAYAGGGILYVEHKVDFSHVINFPDSFGTSDAVILAGDELQVHDLKYGRGVKVDAERNEQLMLYALGALNDFECIVEIKSVRLVIHQPRLNTISEWVCTLEELAGFAEEAKEACTNIEKGEADYAPGEKQCRFCPAKAVCLALAEEVKETIGIVEFDDLTEDLIERVKDEPANLLAAYMRSLKLIEDWCAAVYVEVKRRIAKGEKIEGYKLVAGKKCVRSWTDEQEVVNILSSSGLAEAEIYDKSIKSPAKVEKLLAKDNPEVWQELQSHTSQKEGKPQVVKESDKRPAIEGCTFTDLDADDLI